MKTKNKILLLLSMVIVLSCSKESKSAPPALLGFWDFYKVGTYNSSGNEVLTDYPNNPNCSKDYYFFNADGTLAIVKYTYVASNCQSNVENLQWQETGDLFTTFDGFNDLNWDILSHTSTQFKITNGFDIILLKKRT